MNLTDKFLQFALLGAEWVLWLLVALSVLSVYVMLERWIFFRTVTTEDANVRRPLLASLDDGDFEQAHSQVRESRGPGARMVAQLLIHRGRDHATLDAAVQATRAEEKVRLERNVSFLGTLGANAPFIGLFGTVLGIIRAFDDLAASGMQPGGEQSTAVMTGISEALVATAVGLLVAIPAVVAYNLFQRKLKKVLAQADSLAGHALPFVGAVANSGKER